jgi:hypothetical protein
MNFHSSSLVPGSTASNSSKRIDSSPMNDHATTVRHPRLLCLPVAGSRSCGWRRSLVDLPLQIQPALLGLSAFRIAGGLLIVAGVPVVLDSFARFAIQGLGTPARCFRRNIWSSQGFTATCAIQCTSDLRQPSFGQGLLFSNIRSSNTGLIVWLAFHLFILG